jgi:hypothetical protein
MIAHTSPMLADSRSKAGACLLARALAQRLREAGVSGATSSTDPGLTATGVNVQHDLAQTLGGRLPTTKALHDAAAHHAADGALPISLAALEATPGSFYSPTESRAASLADAATRFDARQLGRRDPVGWDDATVEAFWRRVEEATPGLAEAWGSPWERQDRGDESTTTYASERAPNHADAECETAAA